MILMSDSIYINKQIKKLKELFKSEKIIKNIIENTEIPTDGIEEMYLDEVYFDLERVIEEKNKLIKFIHVIKLTHKYKSELIDKSLILLYNPYRVNRLLDQHLITLNDSFDNL